MAEEGQQLKDLITKPHAMKIGKAVILDKVLLHMMGSPDGKTQRLPLAKAALKAGTTLAEVNQWLSDDVELKERWEAAIKMQQETTRLAARSVVNQAVTGDLDLTDKELVDVSLRVLEKTDKDFNPAIAMEVKSANINFDIPLDELRARLATINI